MSAPSALSRTITNVISADVAAASAFYRSLLGMKEHFASDWYVILTHPDLPGFEFGLLSATSDVTPDVLREEAAGGMLVTFVVADVDAVHAQAQTMGAMVLEPPRDLFYGQRRCLLRDPDGTILDISAPVAPAPDMTPTGDAA